VQKSLMRSNCTLGTSWPIASVAAPWARTLSFSGLTCAQVATESCEKCRLHRVLHGLPMGVRTGEISQRPQRRAN
jgi:hypothetical protein